MNISIEVLILALMILMVSGLQMQRGDKILAVCPFLPRLLQVANVAHFLRFASDQRLVLSLRGQDIIISGAVTVKGPHRRELLCPRSFSHDTSTNFDRDRDLPSSKEVPAIAQCEAAQYKLKLHREY